jgi:hypothetical protein
MNPLLAHQLDEIVESTQPDPCVGLGCAGALRVAAATLSRTRSDLVTATTVVHRLGQDDVQAVEAVVAEIADEFGLDSRLRVHGGSFFGSFQPARACSGLCPSVALPTLEGCCRRQAGTLNG